MRLLLLKSLVLSFVVLASSQAFAQTLELGMRRDSVMLRMRRSHLREGDANKVWDLEFQPAVLADLSGIYTLGFDKANRVEYIQFSQHVGDRLPSATWTHVVAEFRKQKLDSLKEQHELIGDMYRWKKGSNVYTLSNMKGIMFYTAAAPSAIANSKRRLK